MPPTKEQEAAEKAAAEKATAAKLANDAAEKTAADAAEIKQLEQQIAELERAAEPGPEPIRVKALRTGFYGNGRKRAGEEFTIRTERELGTWMERLDSQADGAK